MPKSGGDVVLEARELHAGYLLGANRFVDAVSGVTLWLMRREIFGIAGESGCGKSTLVRVLYGDIEPPLVVRRGRVVVKSSKGDEIDILALRPEERRSKVWWRYISYIPQNAMNVLNPTSRIRDHFAEMYKIFEGLEKEEAYRRAAEYLESLGLPKDVLSAFPHQLSGGMRQRIVIALALLFKPDIVLADEPTSALDVVNQKVVLKMLRELQKKLGYTLVLVSHDMDVHGLMTDRMAVLYAGKIIEIANTEELFEKPLHPYTQALIRSIPRLGDKRVRKGLTGQPPDLANPPPGCRFHPRCPYAMDRCRREEPPMVEVEKGHWVACWLYTKK